MSGLSDAHGFRKRVAGVCMIAAPILLLVGAIVSPHFDGTNESRVLSLVGAHPDRFFLSTVLLIGGLMLLLPALLGLMHMLREREVAYGHVGGGLALVGLMTFFLLAGASLVEWQMLRGGAPFAAMVALLHRFDHTTGTQVFFWLSLCFLGGMVVLAAGLWRARAVHWSTAFVLAAGACLVQAALISNRYWLFIVASAVLLVGFGSVGSMVLSETDDAWDHTPEISGWRPVAMH